MLHETTASGLWRCDSKRLCRSGVFNVPVPEPVPVPVRTLDLRKPRRRRVFSGRESGRGRGRGMWIAWLFAPFQGAS